MIPTEEQIRRAYDDITHGCDGPVTTFVLIGRAIELAAAHSHSCDALSNALFIALADWDVSFEDAITTFHRS